jgi:hypothetical protein
MKETVYEAYVYNDLGRTVLKKVLTSDSLTE